MEWAFPFKSGKAIASRPQVSNVPYCAADLQITGDKIAGATVAVCEANQVL
jgi:hypothetical protein